MKKIITLILIVFSFLSTFSQVDVEKEIIPIKENFKRINAKTSWTKIDSVDIWESIEGGILTSYYSNDNIEKIIVHHFGETFQMISEYYVLDNKLSFVFEKRYNYNMPKISLEDANVIEDRSYFNNNKLIKQLNNQDCGSPFSNEYLQEESKRLLKAFNEYLKLAKNKTNE